ncbi:hypothetical protein MASR2M15_01200 [Anaerolineales bacterium]
MQKTILNNKVLILILMVAFIVRLGVAWSQDPIAPYVFSGGDEGWYLNNGWAFWTGQASGMHRSGAYDLATIPTPPLYLLFVGWPQHLMPDGEAVQMIRFMQVVMSVATLLFIARLASRLGDGRAGIIAALALAINPAFMIEPAFIHSETLYIFLIAGGFYLYFDFAMPAMKAGKTAYRMWILIGIVWGLASLTRAPFTVFPFVVVAFLFLYQWPKGIKRSLWLLATYLVVILLWTAFNLVAYQRFIIISDQLMPALWRGAVETDASPEENDAQLITADDVAACGTDLACVTAITQTRMAEQVSAQLGSDLGAFISLRLRELAEAYLQPHGTIPFGHEGLKDLLASAFAGGFSLEGIGRLLNGEGFWPKLLIYSLHYFGILAGLIGMVVSRRRWEYSLPLIALIVYTTLIHLVLLALPRYIFPLDPIYWVFAAVACVFIWDQLAGARPPLKETSEA